MVSAHAPLPDIAQPASLEARRIAIAAAFHAARTAPTGTPAPAAPAPAAPAPAAPAPAAAASSPAAVAADADDPAAADTTGARLDALAAEVRRLGERLTRVEDGLELVGAGEGEEPLHWPTAVGHDGELGVPPLEVSRRSSPAFDVLLGPHH